MQSDRPDSADEQATDASTPEGPADQAPATEAIPAQDLGQELPQLLADAQAKAAENYDLYLRAVADLENTRRRAAEDVSKAHKFAIEGFAESLLPVRDSLEMALKADSPSVESIQEGVQATLKLFASVFEKHKLIEIDPVGEKFDPNRHQAISMTPVAATNPPVAANHVVSVLQKGYLINDRVLRPALVIVAQG
ncbi:MAG: nucleotide exchange factor GrpE [Quisquiliibacterium sp.]